MNCLKSYINALIHEDGEVATPGNTLGMGNPMVPTDTHPGTEPLVVKRHRKRNPPKNKRYFKNQS